MKIEVTDQLAVLRRMSPAQRLLVAQSLYWQARAWRAASLKALHPEWSEQSIRSRVREQFLYGTTA